MRGKKKINNKRLQKFTWVSVDTLRPTHMSRSSWGKYNDISTLTSSISVADVRKTPDIPESNGTSYGNKEEINGVGILLPLCPGLLFTIRLRHREWKQKRIPAAGRPRDLTREWEGRSELSNCQWKIFQELFCPLHRRLFYSQVPECRWSGTAVSERITGTPSDIIRCI